MSVVCVVLAVRQPIVLPTLLAAQTFRKGMGSVVCAVLAVRHHRVLPTLLAAQTFRKGTGSVVCVVLAVRQPRVLPTLLAAQTFRKGIGSVVRKLYGSLGAQHRTASVWGESLTLRRRSRICSIRKVLNVAVMQFQARCSTHCVAAVFHRTANRMFCTRPFLRRISPFRFVSRLEYMQPDTTPHFC